MVKVKVEGTAARGWYVVVLVYEQEMWETLVHAATYASKARADSKARQVEAAIRQAERNWDHHLRTAEDIMAPCKANLCEDGTPKFMGLDLRHWIWSPSPCIPFACLQKAPTAKTYTVA